MIKRQIVFSYDSSIALQFLPHFVLRRCPENFPKPPSEYGHYPYFLEYKSIKVTGKLGITENSYDLSEKPMIENFKMFPIDDHIAQIDADKCVIEEIIFLINAISIKHIFRYSSNQGWFIELEGEHKLFYGQEGYSCPEYDSNPSQFNEFPNYHLIELPILEFTNKAGISTRSVNLSELFNIYFLAGNSVKKKKYLNACFVLSKAFELRKVDWSASYVFLVSAIETLIDIEYGNEKPKICETCKMPHHAVRKKYLEFLDRYGYKIDKQTKDLFSKIRNEIVHKGKLLGMSYSHKWVIETQDDLDAQYFSTIDHLNYESFRELVQTCFRTFLLFNFERKSS